MQLSGQKETDVINLMLNAENIPANSTFLTLR